MEVPICSWNRVLYAQVSNLSIFNVVSETDLTRLNIRFKRTFFDSLFNFLSLFLFELVIFLTFPHFASFINRPGSHHLIHLTMGVSISIYIWLESALLHFFCKLSVMSFNTFFVFISLYSEWFYVQRVKNSLTLLFWLSVDKVELQVSFFLLCVLEKMGSRFVLTWNSHLLYLWFVHILFFLGI